MIGSSNAEGVALTSPGRVVSDRSQPKATSPEVGIKE